MPDVNFYPLTIADVRPETDTAVCVSFDVPLEHHEKFKFIQGQFLTLKTEIDGEEVRRSYSICSGVQDGSLRVGIKRVRNGRFSNFANDNFKKGDVVDVMPPQGSFYSELDPDKQKNYMCIAAGSGITPIISIIKSALETTRRSAFELYRREIPLN